ncbi:MAG TPA: LuxR C-terminal-related transcriptional regulator [Microbacterium sp.]|nr:LuxR C-terminal-related transcriptional regulator [Microbacterium sp.]
MSWPHRPVTLGRDALVEELADAARKGETRFVSGQAGIGKSHLLARVAGVVRRERAVFELIATRAAAALPLGVFLPVLDRVETTFEAATRLRLTLVETRPLLAVDDAHLLDAASAGLLLELARGGVPLLVGVKEGSPIEEALESIERSCATPRMSIPPLTETELARLVRTRVGALPDPGLVAMVRQRSDGIPLYAVEILDVLVQSDRIGYESGTAYVRGGGTAPHAVGLRGAAGRLSAGGLRVARLVALARELPAPMARALAPSAAVEEAEIAGVVGVRTRAGAVVFAPTHSWLAESLTAAMPVSVRLGLMAQLVDAMPASASDPLLAGRALIWRTQLGRLVTADELLEVAARVQHVAPTEADRLLDAAAERATSIEHRLRLAKMLAHQHRVGDAEAVISGLDAADLTPELRRQRDLVHAFVLSFPANDPARAVALLRTHTDEDDPLVLAYLSSAFLQLGDIPAAIRVGRSVLSDTSAPAVAHAHAALTVSAGLVHSGRLAEFDAFRQDRDLLVARADEELPIGAESATLIDQAALLEVREALDAAQALAHASYERALTRQDEGMRAQHSHQLARIALERGAPGDALPWAIGAVVADGLWALAMRAWTTATLIEVLTLGGRSGEAEEHRKRAAGRPRSARYDIDIARATAVLSAAGGDVEGAAERLAAAATQALARGQLMPARSALDQAVRYGSDAAARALLRIKAAPALEALARSQTLARAWLERDVAALDAAVRDHVGRGLLWRGMETAALSSRANGGVESTTLSELRARCPSLRSPAVPEAPPTVLTGRESDLARRAAGGQSDAEIAHDTGLSIRTVQTHLSNIYHKLGIRSRADLAGRLHVEPDVRTPAGT